MFFDPNQPECKYLNRVADIELPLLLAKDRERGSSDLTRVSAPEAAQRGLVQAEWSAYFMALSVKFAGSLGIPFDKQRFEEKLPTERSHYSAQTFDHQIWLDRWGWTEIAGHAYRTDYDLSAHSKATGADLSIFKPYPQPVDKKAIVVVPLGPVLGPLLREKARSVVEALTASNAMEVKKAFDTTGYFDVQGFRVLPSHVRFEERNIRETGRRVVPYVVEPSYGAERVVYSALEYAYARVKDRIVLRLPIHLVPLQVAVFPLMAKDGLSEIASEITNYLASDGFSVEYDESGTIGRRYARADEVGIPLSITVDYQTKKDATVTLRDRDSWEQVRNGWKTLPDLMRKFLQSKLRFAELGTPVQVDYE